MAGYTLSTDFPGTAGGAQPASGGGIFDVFVARLTGTLTTLTQATYLGGSAGDSASALAIHPMSGDVYVAGGTDSTNFPGTTGGAQPARNGLADAFIARLSRTLATGGLLQSTYLGGSGLEEVFSLAIAPLTGDVYVAGYTTSIDFPGTAGGVQPAHGGGSLDAFVARLPSTLTTLTQATYLGGSDFEPATAVAIHPSGDVYVAGGTTSTNFPGTGGGAQAVINGVADAFVARLTFSLALIDPPLPVPTLSEWAQIAMVGLLVVSGLLALRRRCRQPPRRA